jgi:hypothetical protein
MLKDGNKFQCVVHEEHMAEDRELHGKDGKDGRPIYWFCHPYGAQVRK